MAEAIQAAGKKDIGPGWVLLFYTGYTLKNRSSDCMHHPELTAEACKFIAEKKVNAVGIDAPGLDRGEFPAH